LEGKLSDFRQKFLLSNVFRDQQYLESLVAEVEKNVEGKRVTFEGEDDGEESGYD
jgi:hypothetical protein